MLEATQICIESDDTLHHGKETILGDSDVAIAWAERTFTPLPYSPVGLMPGVSENLLKPDP